MEIAGLNSGDVLEHLEPAVIVVTHGKGDKPRVIPVAPVVITALHAHGLSAYGPVFRDEFGDALKPWKISQMLRAHMYGCGVNASAHQLRHSYGTEMYRRSGGDLRMVQDLMGHASPVTTAGYAAWDQNKAAAVVATLFT
jgi:integrase/recombinase XerC